MYTYAVHVHICIHCCYCVCTLVTSWSKGQIHCAHNFIIPLLSVCVEAQVNGGCADEQEDQEDQGRPEPVKPAEPAIVEEHMTCVTGVNEMLVRCFLGCRCTVPYNDIVPFGLSRPQGILEDSLQKYGSLIPIHVDDVVERLQEIFHENFSQPHR